MTSLGFQCFQLVIPITPEDIITHCETDPARFRSAARGWWRHKMVMLSTLLACCEGNPPVPGGFPAQRASNANLECVGFFLNKLLNCLWFETPWSSCMTSYFQVQNLQQKGDRAFERDNYSDALRFYNEALEIDENSQEVLAARTAVYLKIGNAILAQHDVEKLLMIQPNHPQVSDMRWRNCSWFNPTTHRSVTWRGETAHDSTQPSTGQWHDVEKLLMIQPDHPQVSDMTWRNCSWFNPTTHRSVTWRGEAVHDQPNHPQVSDMTWRNCSWFNPTIHRSVTWRGETAHDSTQPSTGQWHDVEKLLMIQPNHPQVSDMTWRNCSWFNPTTHRSVTWRGETAHDSTQPPTGQWHDVEKLLMIQPNHPQVSDMTRRNCSWFNPTTHRSVTWRGETAHDSTQPPTGQWHDVEKLLMIQPNHPQVNY